MPSIEKQLGIIRDFVLLVDVKNRYDVYFTDRRVAIIFMGRANRSESDSFGPISLVPAAFGVPAPTESYVEPKANRQSIEEEMKKMSIDEILRLSKKSVFYTYDEIEELKLILGRKPKFLILSEECESKFLPDPEQLMSLIDLLPKIEPLKSKLSVAGNWNVLQEIFRSIHVS